MTGLLYFIAILWIVAGTMLILYTEWTKNACKSIVFPAYLRLYSILPLIVGVFLVSAAFYHKEVFWLAIIIGVLGIAKGIFMIVGSLEKLEALLRWWYEEASDRTARFLGLITFLVGVALFSRLV